MPNQFYRVLVSATSKEEAIQIIKTLAEAKLAAGGLITNGESIYWWDNALTEKIYYNISLFTQEEHKEKIIQAVKKIHKDKTPVIAFFKIDDANKDFLDWVKEFTS